jgi:hypothetical protein
VRQVGHLPEVTLRHLAQCDDSSKLNFRNEFSLMHALWQALLNVRIAARRWQYDLSFSENKFGCQTPEWYVIA